MVVEATATVAFGPTWRRDKRGRFVLRSGLLRRMKGWGKDPFGTAICCVELVGPSRFSHWGEDGQPVGQAHPAAWILVAAVARDQTRTTMTLFDPMLSARAKEEYAIDGGTEIIYANHGRVRLE